MSKNPAWTAFNEAERQSKADYEETIGPLRKELNADLAATEKKYNDKIAPLVAERNKALEQLRQKYTDAAMGASDQRNAVVRRAREVLKAELAAVPKASAKVE